MTKNLSYQTLFSSYKGVGHAGQTFFVLPVTGTDYELVPVNCSEKNIDSEVVALLTHARNSNPLSFLTMFTATEEGTRKWLSQVVAKEHNRILFMLKNKKNHSYYGYMGLAFGDKEGGYIEADAVVRIAKHKIHGLMKASLVGLLQWVRNELGINTIGVRVLTDNAAIAFYEKCGFVKQKIIDLYESKDLDGKLVALETNRRFLGQKKSRRSLCYMTAAGCLADDQSQH